MPARKRYGYRLQILGKAGGFALMPFVDSPQSKEEDDRPERKLNATLRALDPQDAQRSICELDRRLLGRGFGSTLQ
jgi:hypothetical protein